MPRQPAAAALAPFAPATEREPAKSFSHDQARLRVVPDGNHLSLGGRPFRVRGVTYGSFATRHDGQAFPSAQRVRSDFAMIAAAGLNTVRTYTVPPADVLGLAEEFGLRLLVGLHYDDWRSVPETGRRARRRILDAGRRAVASAMECCAGRASVIALSVGNEVPSDLVRVHGSGAVEETLSRLVEEVHAADAGMLATYCNYPTTEYLQVEGQDLICFNVFLEQPEPLRAYLRRLQVISGDLPLVLTEMGLASEVHGEVSQARAIDRMLYAVDECGCAGATVFCWTDDWVVAGHPVEGWGFGLTHRDRSPKLALNAVTAWARRGLADLRLRWPRVSVVVCGYNAQPYLDRCLASAVASDYPALDVLYCDDGSTDDSVAAARRHPVTVIELPHQGLATARNAGLEASSGEIVAYLDADAECHPEWPYHLALSLEDPVVAAAGGPNLPFPNAGLVERAVASAPGGPVHVLIGDDRAEHVPGCNMAVRRTALKGIGGFHTPFVAAGDDVDICWRLLDSGQQIGFAAAAQVRHHARPRVRAYLRQQRTYGAAERMVCGRHTHRFNRLGQSRWAGFIYGFPRLLPRLLRPVVYHGTFGSAPYQGVLRRPAESVVPLALALLPLTVPLLLLGLALAPVWRPGLAVSGLAAALAAAFGAAMAAVVRPDRREPSPMAFRLLVGCLYVAQPLVRTWGRLRARPLPPTPSARVWSGDRVSWLAETERQLSRWGCACRRPRPDAEFDLEASLVGLAVCRVMTAVAWGWLPRFRTRVRPGRLALPVLAVGAVLGLARPGVGAAVLAGAGAVAAFEAWQLTRLVRRVLIRTSREVG
ncbi:MAG TPA: glycosyltransferase [Candidatus Dormibacteraeota bacterium]|nr:glycosyltransferase [Candidatus Dormibacteraeota bacterium]